MNRIHSASLLALLVSAGSASVARTQPPVAALQQVSAAEFEALQKVFVQFVEHCLDPKNLPAAANNPRENALGILNLYWAAAGSGMIVLPVAGTAIGTGLAGIPSVGIGAVPGGALGFGVGAAGSLGVLMGSAVVSVAALEYIEARYPFAKYSSQLVAPVAPPARIELLRPAHAGLMESLLIKQIQALPKGLVDLARTWDRTQGLPVAAATWLKQHDFLRPPLQRLAEIHASGRLSPTSGTAMALPGITQWIQLPTGDELRQGYLAALGVTHTRLQMRGGRLELEVPKVLDPFFQDDQVQLDIPDVSLKVGGKGGLLDPYVEIEFKPGTVQLDFGKVELVASGSHKDQIAMSWSIAKGARPGALRVQWKWNGPEQTVAQLKPRLERTFKGTIFLKVEGLALVPAGVSLNDFEVDLDLPKELREAVDQLKDCVQQAVGKAAKGLEQMFERRMPWDKAWKKLGAAPGKSLAQFLKEQHLDQVAGMVQGGVVKELRLVDGRFEALVEGVGVALAQLPLKELQKEWAKHCLKHRLNR